VVRLEKENTIDNGENLLVMENPQFILIAFSELVERGLCVKS